MQVRRILACDWCGYEVYSGSARTDAELRQKAAEGDAWRVIDGQDVCGQLHAREKEPTQ